MVVPNPVFLNRIKVLLFFQHQETVADFTDYSLFIICYKSEAQALFCYFCRIIGQLCLFQWKMTYLYHFKSDLVSGEQVNW